MSFEIYLRDDIGNQISGFVDVGKKFTVTTLDLNEGLLKKGSYRIPIEHILFIKEV